MHDVFDPDLAGAKPPFAALIRVLRRVARRVLAPVLVRQTRYNAANAQITETLARAIESLDLAGLAVTTGGSADIRREMLDHDALVLNAMRKRIDELKAEWSNADRRLEVRLRSLEERLRAVETASGKTIERPTNQPRPRTGDPG